MNRHTKLKSLHLLSKLIPISSIIDVGVSDQTIELVYLFPNKPQVLIEPNEAVYKDIHQQYSNIVHTLIKTAVDQKNTLDNEMLNISYSAPYLLKIDVDGSELDVLAGAVNTLPLCSCVVIECVVGAGINIMADMLNFFKTHNFSLWDITDMAYYRNNLWQVDLVLINNNFMPAQGPELVQRQYWQDDSKNWVLDRTVLADDFLSDK